MRYLPIGFGLAMAFTAVSHGGETPAPVATPFSPVPFSIVVTQVHITAQAMTLKEFDTRLIRYPYPSDYEEYFSVIQPPAIVPGQSSVSVLAPFLTRYTPMFSYSF